ncbi:MAG: hypothetical protein HY744_17145, partial [Deltaproteobacteria bacterium]|nr:hypothetical protein [Deltaproteobacteria bacterium]
MPSSSSPASWLRPGQAPPTAFAQLDAVVSDGGQYGVLCVELAADGFAPLARHVARRARQCGRPALVAAGSELAEPWRELCRDLGLGDATEPAELASRIVRAAARAIGVAGGG